MTRDAFQDADVAAWFLGPRGENADVLERLAVAAIRSAVRGRQAFHPEDPVIIDAATRNSPRYRETVRRIQDRAEALMIELRGSEPFSSMRYHGHMNWDAALPGLVGYLAGMLYNPNNCGSEGSPVTTPMEIAAGEWLCRMVGFGPAGWGHLTSGGSVANIEGLWALREARYHPAAVAAALRGEEELACAREVEVTLPEGCSARLLDLDPWQLCSLTATAALDLNDAITKEFGIDPARLTDIVRRYSLRGQGWLRFHADMLGGAVEPPVVLAPASAHYSWPKAAIVLGFGAEAVRYVPLDTSGRMDAEALAAMLDAARAARQPAFVVAVTGSTELGMVDPLHRIVDLREKFRAEGWDFGLHADAAWGGYFAAMLPHGAFGIPGPVPTAGLKPEVMEALTALGAVDTLTVDPHKAGYVPYPAGALLHRDDRMRNLVSVSAPVVRHDAREPNIGVFGMEGSKPGAAAAAVKLTHEIIGLDGYAKILGQCMWTSKRICLRLASLQVRRPELGIRVDLVQPLTAAPERIADLARLDNQALEERLSRDPDALALFAGIGSDLLVPGFVVNVETETGWITDAGRLNRLTSAIFDRCSYRDATRQREAQIDVIFTKSEVTRAQTGPVFHDHLAERLRLAETGGASPIGFLIASVLNPWSTDTANPAERDPYDHFDRIEDALIRAVEGARKEPGC